MFTRWQDLDVDLYCTGCGAPARPTPPTTWSPNWGSAPLFSHQNGRPLCRTTLPRATGVTTVPSDTTQRTLP